MKGSVPINEDELLIPKVGLDLLRGFKSYLPDAILLPKSSMKLHLQNELECNWVVKEGSMVGPMVAFGKFNHVVFLVLNVVCYYSMWFIIESSFTIRWKW